MEKKELIAIQKTNFTLDYVFSDRSGVLWVKRDIWWVSPQASTRTQNSNLFTREHLPPHAYLPTPYIRTGGRDDVFSESVMLLNEQITWFPLFFVSFLRGLVAI